ncbi:unnamed protein product [Albugo candida]|uniref:Uncharacterized protein n=1 Tax=Albugo candida TaxID=65357 RepID=A0A024FW19_9STRA|nr:unnamed protein product [Albugo candida]|eukprot:CCI11320.1 unnamed protein product [Albugo candida]
MQHTFAQLYGVTQRKCCTASNNRICFFVLLFVIGRISLMFKWCSGRFPRRYLYPYLRERYLEGKTCNDQRETSCSLIKYELGSASGENARKQESSLHRSMLKALY